MSKKKFQRSLCWIRRDLRLTDHTALQQATLHSAEVAVVFVFDTHILNQLKDVDDRRLTFIFDSLMEMKKKLEDQFFSYFQFRVREIKINNLYKLMEIK